MTDLDHIIRTVVSMRPQPLCVNQKQAAEMLGLSIPTLKNHIKDGKILLNDIGMIPIAEINKLAVTKVRNG